MTSGIRPCHVTSSSAIQQKAPDRQGDKTRTVLSLFYLTYNTDRPDTMKNCVAFAILVLCVASAHGIVWKDCGSKRSKVKDVLVTGCEKSKVCALPRGSNVTFTVDFTTNAGADGAKSVVHGIIDRIPLPFPIAHPDACTDKSCGLTCPLKASKSYSFHQNIYVHSAYPKVKAVVKWELRNKESEDIFCVMVAAQITDAKKKDLNRTKLRYANRTPKLFQLL